MKRILLDTNAYGAFLAGRDEIFDALGKADIVYMSVSVLGELYAGFRGGTKARENKTMLGRFLAKPTVAVLHVTHETAEVFGEVKDRLKTRGTPIPLNDIWIAAQAIDTGSQVVSYDAHFRNIDGLRCWDL